MYLNDLVGDFFAFIAILKNTFKFKTYFHVVPKRKWKVVDAGTNRCIYLSNLFLTAAQNIYQDEFMYLQKILLFNEF